jgi:DNA polymerase-1
MRTIAIDTEYDYCDPFLVTITDDELQTRVYRPKIVSHRKALRKICSNRNIRKVFHHASGDIFILRNIGVDVKPPYECTLIASNLVNEQYASRNLKKLAELHLGIETREANRLKGIIKKYKERAKAEGRRFRWSEIPDEYIVPYAKRDPEYTIQLWFYWTEPLKEVEKLYEFERSLIPIIVDMEWKGMRIDRALCLQKSREYGKNIERLHDEMVKFLVDNKIDLGRDFNPRSPKQMQEIVKALGLEYEVERSAKTGELSVDKKQIQKLAVDHKFFGLLSQYRFFNKHKTTYYDPLYQYYTSDKDDRAHFMLYQTGAKTGRFSAELIQTFPRPEESALVGKKHEVRKAVIPARGKVLLCKDYEQQEMRLFIHFANCKRMIDIINKKGGKDVDCYVETANILFGKLFENEKYRKALRFVAKHQTLGMIYGEGVNKLVTSTSVMMRERFGDELVNLLGVNDKWAYAVLQNMYGLYPVRQFMNEQISKLYRLGYLEMEFHSALMNFKRRYYVPQDKAYKAVNVLIQGSAAYVIKHAMKRIDDRIREEGWVGKVDMIMQVHDELIFEVDKSMDLKKVNEVLSQEMEDHVTFRVPITTSAKWSDKSWGDVKELEV